MEPIKVTDEWLYQYMPMVDEAIIRELEATTDYEYRFSDKFERKMNKLVWAEAHPQLDLFCRRSQRAAIFLFCTVSFIFLLSMSVQANRIKFFETVKTIYEDSVLYSYFADEVPESLVCNEPDNIPVGYHETDRIITDHFFSITYENNAGELIIFDQMLILDGGSLAVDSEYDTQVIREINGGNVIISLYADGFTGTYYEHGEYVYLLTAEKLSIEEICTMIESIK